ncbi:MULTISPECIES: MarR family winged helix-turn-helix transcriptional regulator [Rhizobium]|jgi:DNA-binding MarR family transcriptional regulator|uniref:MarR family transcriptional regulator n=1 Tax=Rhizobium anhuiense TaxID=1184720 RepID=A0A432NK08_9HYPH|nr:MULTISPECIES: MarR family transcriptional regulator [Rhizobium]MBB3301098.1 DNA-binding MarR family transcriptional regulator [Rhizobium sp. BK112]MBB3368721.1 DNA-binding MarR family transcriptional regulator [Rhizobium sp. BK077]MBB3741677.1 DNA-binding MarR family transcriptional regulator [Rhizobium sp. BK591]MBB4113006.1 DNA-binding MarR family transcriptional regulator [Rhizobium sp. BK226]MBB4180988.1 DNA-binding MarR family transcriptional regulator [Rhizobium sp. BK109]
MNKNQSLPWDHPRFRSWIAVARACQLMQQTLSRSLADLDIKPPHLDILVNIYRFEGISQQELARKLLVGRSNMSMLLPQMEHRRLIERRGDERDKRVLRLHLTPEGRKLTEAAMAIQTDLIERTLSEEPIEQCMATATSMERIIAMLLKELRDDD